MRRGCLFGIGAVLLLCVVTLGLGIFVALPRARDAVRDSAAEALATEIALQLPPVATPSAATYVLREDALNASLRQRVAGLDIADEITVTITPAYLQLRLVANERATTYTGQVAAAGGRLDVTNMTAEGMYEVFLSASTAASLVEEAMNGYLAAQRLQLTDITLGDGILTLQVQPEG
ncbi:MAG: hypothetical protein C4346_18965 [Chloroflexota bacterium]